MCQNCDGDEDKLKVTAICWIHIAGEHEWIDGECDHGLQVAAETGKTYLDKNSKAFEAILKVVLDQKFLKSFHHYVTFRHIVC